MLAQSWRTFRGLKIQKLAPSVIDMVTEFSTGELVGMEGEFAGRCNFLAQQQAMRVYVGLDMIWLDFVSRRPMPLGGDHDLAVVPHG